VRANRQVQVQGRSPRGAAPIRALRQSRWLTQRVRCARCDRERFGPEHVDPGTI